ncbi:putative membrane protein YccC [Methylobacterium sp. OAE515]
MALALPTRGQVGRKGLWRVGGTILGLGAGLAGVAGFAQDSLAMGTFVALWFALNAYVGGRLPGLASYGAALSGLTAGLIVALSATDPGSALEIALARGAEIVLGVGCVYVASALAEIAQGSPPARASAPPTVLPSAEMVTANAVRAFLVVAVAWAIWVTTAWPSGGLFVVFAGVVSVVFVTMPDGDLRARDYLWGAALGQATGLVVKYALLSSSSSFEMLAAVLFPFLLIGGIGMTDQRKVALTLGYNLSFLIALEPRNPMQYDLAASLNEAAAVFAGIAFGVLAFRVVFPYRIWRGMR